jgi:hypothetical protein
MKLSTKLSAVSSSLAIAAVLGFPGPVQAHTIGTVTATIAFPSSGLTHTMDTSLGPNSQPGLVSGTEVTPFTAFEFLPGLADNKFAAWCIEPQEFAESGAKLFNVNTLEQAPVVGSGNTMGDRGSVLGVGTRADDMRRLFGGVYEFANNTFSNVNAGLGLSAQDVRTAFQLSVWEIANETALSYNVAASNGIFFLSSGGGPNSANVVLQANAWLGNLANYHPEAGLYALVRNPDDTPNGQDFIVKAVPIPAAAWLFGSAILGTVALGRRKLKESAEA